MNTPNSRTAPRGRAPALQFALSTLAISVAIAMGTLPAPAHAQETPVRISIAAQPLSKALLQLGEQTSLHIFFSQDIVEGYTAPALSGSLSPEDALRRLLAGTGITYRRTGNNVALAKEGPAGAVQLTPVLVTGRTDPVATEGTGAYTTHDVSLGKGQAVRDIPQSVSVVTRQRIEEQNLSSLTEVLDKTTGLTLQRAGNSAGSSLGNDTNFYSRGFAVSNVQLDGGAPMDTVMNGFGSISQIDMAQYDHVEFLRGIDGLFSSTGDPGGTVNLVRKRARADRQTTVAASVASWNNTRLEGDVTGALNADGSLRGRAGVMVQNRNYFYDTAENKTRLIYGALERDITRDTLVTLGASYQQSRGTPDFAGLPRYSSGADLGLSRSTALIPDWAYTRDSTREVYAKLEHRFNDDWSVNANALYASMRRDHSGAYGFGAVDPLTGQGNYLYTYPEVNDMSRVALDVNLKGKVSAFGREHTVLVGADYQRGHADSQQYMGYQGYALDVFNPRFPAEDLPAAPLKDSYYNTQKRALYGMMRLQLHDPLHVIAGARYSRYTYKSDSWETTGSGYAPGVRHLKESGVFTPYLGLTYDILPQWTAYASYAETFKPQYMQRQGPAPGTPLAAVESKNTEVGVKGEVFDGRANVAFSVYRIAQTGAAAEDPNYPRSWGAFNCCYINQGKVVSEGFEAELTGELLAGWQLSAGYTYNSNSDKQARQSFSTITPKHQLKLWSTYRLPAALNAWRVGGGVIAQSATFVRGTATPYNPATGAWDGASVPFNFSQAGYAVWSARIDYRINPQWSVALNVNNLFDKRYYAGVGTSASGNFYGEPRNYHLSVRGTF